MAEIRQRLDELTEHLCQILLSEPFASAPAAPIGAALVDLHFLSPQALAGTLEALGTEVPQALSPDQAAVLQPRLVQVLAAMAGGFYAAGRDAILREQEEVRAALFVSRQEAEAANEARLLAEATAQARSDLLGRVAHDLRSPLTGIRGQADLIAQRSRREAPPLDWLRARVQAIRNASDRMQGMISELLDAARLQLGEQLDLQLSNVDVGDTLARVLEHMEPSRQRVHVDIEGTPVIAIADRARLERVLENVLSNALKYSPTQSPVEVAVRAADHGARITVVDYGYGIPADELPRVTTPFYRASTARSIPGVGLGLSGVKAIVEQHGGALHITSKVGEGTSVTISLPREPREVEA